MHKVAIQGEIASFHDIAAQKLFDSEIEIVCCNTFGIVFHKLKHNEVDYAVVAIENSLYGSINEVYDLLLHNPVSIHGEVYLRIKQNLIGIQNTPLSDIKEVHSHPVALAQCQAYLDEHLPHAERFEHVDTAGSVADVKKWNDVHKVAIASEEAAKLHDMSLLAEEIETNKQNYTRFVLLKRKSSQVPEDANKSSLIIQTSKDTKAGALYSALGVFAKRNINLSALHSRPIVGKAWHYMFYVDIDIGSQDKEFNEIMSELDAQDCNVTVLGSYKKNMS